MDDVLVPGGGRKYFSMRYTSVKREALQREGQDHTGFSNHCFSQHLLAAMLISPSLFVELIHLLCRYDIGSFDLFIVFIYLIFRLNLWPVHRCCPAGTGL